MLVYLAFNQDLLRFIFLSTAFNFCCFLPLSLSLSPVSVSGLQVSGEVFSTSLSWPTGSMPCRSSTSRKYGRSVRGSWELEELRECDQRIWVCGCVAVVGLCVSRICVMWMENEKQQKACAFVNKHSFCFSRRRFPASCSTSACICCTSLQPIC